ncbi:EYxxD motif small membrane protein [Salsuginibacillus kocurii]
MEFGTDSAFIYALILGCIIVLLYVWFKRKRS